MTNDGDHAADEIRRDAEFDKRDACATPESTRRIFPHRLHNRIDTLQDDFGGKRVGDIPAEILSSATTGWAKSEGAAGVPVGGTGLRPVVSGIAPETVYGGRVATIDERRRPRRRQNSA